jgi:putative hydrolase of the HAD superfamily
LTELSSPGPIRAVFFDAVGTTLLPAASIAATYREVGSRHGAELDESIIRARLRLSFEKQEQLDRQVDWRTNEEREVERWRSIVRETLAETANQDACFADLWEWFRLPSAWAIAPQTGLVLHTLARRGLTLGMASNFDARLTGIVSAFAELAPLADRCVISSLIGWRKPSHEFFQEVIARADCTPSEVLFVGDDVRNDFEGARRAGMQAVLFDPAGKAELAERIAELSEIL